MFVVIRDPRFSDETVAFLQSMITDTPLQLDAMDIETFRQYAEETHRKYNKSLLGTFQGTLENKTVKTNLREIPITIYTPIDAHKNKLLIYFHGGGWVIGSLTTIQTIVNMIAEATKTVCISVGYPLGPEHKYPIWLDESADVTQYIIQNKANYGVDSTAKVGVAGDSAGGTIAASLCHTLKGIDFQILVYAALDILGETPSYKEFANPMYYVTPEFMDWFVKHAFHSRDDAKDSRISLLSKTSFEELPPCLFVLTELDIFRDGNLQYQKLLEKAGVQTKLVTFKDTVHIFFGLPGAFPKASGEAINAIRDFMASI